MFKAGIADPNSMKQQIPLHGAQKKEMLVSYACRKPTYRNTSVDTQRKGLFSGKGCPLKVSYVGFDELPW